MARLFILLLIGSALMGIGCSSGETFKEDYKAKVEETPEQKAKGEEIMKGQQAPGTLKR